MLEVFCKVQFLIVPPSDSGFLLTASRKEQQQNGGFSSATGLHPPIVMKIQSASLLTLWWSVHFETDDENLLTEKKVKQKLYLYVPCLWYFTNCKRDAFSEPLMY